MPDDLTSLHVQRAIQGDDGSRSWIVEHFGPVLLLQARYRLRGRRVSCCEPEDLVDEVWAVALARLPQLRPREDRWTPVFVRFLSTTLMHQLNMAVRRHLRRERDNQEVSELARVPESATSIPSRVARLETSEAVRAVLEELSEKDREVLVLRGIEQIPNQEVADLLGQKPGTVAMRYGRALQHLRAALPHSVFAELPENP